VVRTVTAAAGRQARVVVGWEGFRKRSQTKEQNEQDRKQTPHLDFMLHEGALGCFSQGLLCGGQVSSGYCARSMINER
jgi:hypothetical protein